MKASLTTAAFLAASISMAQTPPPTEGVRVLTHKISDAGAWVAGAPADNINFVATEFSFADKTVTGAPYSAEAVTETTQTLADGNKISRKNSAQVFRDSQGRTRRDQTIEHIGPWSTQSGFKSSIIHDPVAGQHYILEPQTKIARKLPDLKLTNVIRSRVPGAESAAEPPVRMTMASPAHPAVMAEEIRIAGPQVELRRIGPGGVGPQGSAAFNNESLGTKALEGLVAEGTRTILTIPAGQIGNERPIEVVPERWYSPELQVVVMTRNSDPRTGETVYKLINVQRGEPGRHLFEVPPDYTIKESNTRQPHFEVFKPAVPPQN
jgi:hypothetical protein